MAFPVSILTTRPQCNEVLEDLQTEVEDLLVRQTNYNHRDERATDRATDNNVELASVDRRISNLNRELAEMDATDTYRPRREAELRAAVKRRGDLNAQLATNPAAAFRAAVDARQVAVQIPELQQAIAEVTAYRDRLPE